MTDADRAREVLRMREAATAWRLPQYRQVEGPDDLKIYGGTIADDIDRWADMIAEPCGWDRNAVARVIDPAAFPTVGCTILSDELGKLADDLGIGSPATKALAKADAIRSLLAFATPPMVAESGEVIQADREAAAVFETHPQAARAVIAGRSDGSIFVQAFRDHRLSALRALPASQAREGETWASIAAWCEETFGPCSPDRIAGRASEEMSELIDETEITIDWTDKAREEAADVLICLSRAPDIWEAVERKMAINRACEWRIMGDGTGYHIRSGNEPPAALTPSPVVGEGKDVRPSYLSTLKLVQEATFTSPTPSVGEQEL